MLTAESFVTHFYDRYAGRVPISVAMGMGLRDIYPFVFEDAHGHAQGLIALGVVADRTTAVVQIFHLSAFHPRRGRGTRMLAELCAEADRHAVTLTTTPLVMTSGEPTRMSDRALADWYRRHGFEGDTLLHRTPR